MDYFTNSGRRYCAETVVLPGKKRLHRVVSIMTDAVDSERLWGGERTICGKLPPWDDRYYDDRHHRQRCGDCLFWQQVFEREVPEHLRPAY